MKERWFNRFLCFVLFWVVLTSSLWAGQVVTEEARLWAKKVLEEEKAIQAVEVRNTLAVLYFQNRTRKSELNPLQKGLALMLMTDLSKVRNIQVLERVKVQALIEEMDLGVSGLVEPDTAPRAGNLLGAQWLVGGDISGDPLTQLQIQSNILDVPTPKILPQQIAKGKLADVFRIEKELLFGIIKLLKIESSPEEKEELKKPISTNIDALIALFKGIEASDHRNYKEAVKFYETALREDPGISIANEALKELQTLDLITAEKRSPGIKDVLDKYKEAPKQAPKETPKEAHDELRSVKTGDPTFIQTSQRDGERLIPEKSVIRSKVLFAKISVPYEDSLVRANVPIFGLAYGKDFKEYRVEYGEGKEPKEWFTITTSTLPQIKDVTAVDLDESADITIHGNLATWDTGLKNYVYLPSHPKDHPVDLNGVYTVRLVVVGKDGSTTESRVTVEVGDVIPNAWGGRAISKDGKVALTVPEQSLMDSFRLFSIKPVEEGAGVSVDNKRKLVGKVYEFREVGGKFTKDAILEMRYSENGLRGISPDRLGIYSYKPERKVWVYLKSMRDEKQKKIIAEVRELAPYYTIFASTEKGEGSVIEGFASSVTRSEQQKITKAVDDNKMYLVMDTFEDGMGEWSNRDGDAGAMVSRDNAATFDGIYCLKLTNTNDGGNFASNVRRTPFDAREHPIVQFDYKIPPDVKINFLVKVNSRWYEIGFTGDPKELRNARVNIANIGRIENVIADDKWHTARFNLYDMLRTKTGNHIVKEMIMADWNVGGYMKLRFGTNRQGATYYIDNFIISKESTSEIRIDGGVLLIDNFDQKKEVNSLGGISNVFTDSVEGKAQLSYVGNDNNPNRRSHALKISYDVSQKGSFAGYMTQLRNLDIGEYKTLSFAIKGSKSREMFKIGIKDSAGNESKVLVNDYVPQEIGTTWQRVAIPLAAFTNIKDWGAMENLSLAFENSIGSGEGAVLLDDIQFEKDLKSLVVNNFENDNDSNLLGGKSWTFSNGAAGINGGYEKDSSSKVYRLSYGGKIGDLFTYAGWTTQLQGIDVSQCKSVSLLIKGAAGGEEPNIYMDDGNFRWGVYITRYKPTTASWQKVTIPLKDFADYGVDLTHLEELQVVFEWERMSGAIYIDDIRFDCSGDKVKEK